MTRKKFYMKRIHTMKTDMEKIFLLYPEGVRGLINLENA